MGKLEKMFGQIVVKQRWWIIVTTVLIVAAAASGIRHLAFNAAFSKLQFAHTHMPLMLFTSLST